MELDEFLNQSDITQTDPETLDAAIDQAFASLEQAGRAPEQARLELEIRHPDLAKPIATTFAVRSMLGTQRGERSAAADLPLPRPFGREAETSPRYTLIRRIGTGANGVVYEAVDAHDEASAGPATVAVKVFSSHQAWWSGERGPFADAARVAAVFHPSLLRIRETGIAACSSPFVVTELATAGSLQAQLDRRADFTTSQIVRIARDVARGLHAAHERGLVHGNLKPANILLFGDASDPDRLLAKLGDFGAANRIGLHLAETADPERKSRLPRRGSIDGSALSEDQLRALRDTLLFAAPERRGGQAVPTTRSDIYSLGASLRYALRFASDVNRTDRRLMRVIERATAAQAGERHASASHLADDLGRWLDGRSIGGVDGPATRAKLWARRSPVLTSAAVLLAVGLTAGAGVATDSQHRRAYEAGRASVTAEFSELVTANAITWDRSNPLRDWLAASVLLDRLGDTEYFRYLPGHLDRADRQAEAVAGRIKLMEVQGHSGTLQWGVLLVEQAMHELRSTERYPDTAALLDKAAAVLEPAMPEHDPLRADLAVLRDVAEVKRFVEAFNDARAAGQPSPDAELLRPAYQRLCRLLASRTDGMSEPLSDRDRRDPVVILALRGVEHLSGASVFDDRVVRAWCVAQHRVVD